MRSHLLDPAMWRRGGRLRPRLGLMTAAALGFGPGTGIFLLWSNNRPAICNGIA